MVTKSEPTVINPEINIGTVINLHDLIKSRLLIQANSGGGKSAIARMIMEKSHGKVPFIVLDIEGEYYTLKELFDDIIVIGGQHADAPISIELGKQLPKFLLENELSVVLDISDMEMSERRRFARVFLESLMALPQQYWKPILVFLEECHSLAGEQDKYESGPAVKDLMSRGRKRGYCGIPITQRISKLHKDVAAECNNKFIGRTYLDIDMERAAKELGFSKSDDKLKLRKLQPGCFYAFGTSIEPHEVHEVQVSKPQTKMPQAGTSMSIVSRAPTRKLISILEKINNDLVKKEAEPAPSPINSSLVGDYLVSDKDLAEYTERIKQELQSQYEREVAIIKTAMETKLAEKVDLVNQLKAQWKAYSDSIITFYQTEIMKYQEVFSKFGKMLDDLKAGGVQLNIPAPEDIKMPELSIKIPEVKISENKFVNKVIIPTRTPPDSKIIPKQTNGLLGKGELATLNAIAQYDAGLRRDQLTVITGYKRSSRDTYIQRLKEKQLIEQSGEKLIATKEGVKALGNDFKPLPKGKELQEFWLGNLPNGEKEILKVLIAHYPRPVDRETLSNITQYTRSSRDTYLQRLSAKELLGEASRGFAIASANLF